MDGSQFSGGPKSSRSRQATRDDAISADPHLLDAWKQAEQDWYDQPGNAEKAAQGSTEGWDAADKALDAMIQRRSDAMKQAQDDHKAAVAKDRAKGPAKSRTQKRYPTAAAASNDNEGD